MGRSIHAGRRKSIRQKAKRAAACRKFSSQTSSGAVVSKHEKNVPSSSNNSTIAQSIDNLPSESIIENFSVSERSTTYSHENDINNEIINNFSPTGRRISLILKHSRGKQTQSDTTSQDIKEEPLKMILLKGQPMEPVPPLFQLGEKLNNQFENRWTVPQIEALIEQYKKYPVLYATNHERHTDRALKNECLRNIVSALETIRFGVTEADVVTQWNNLVLKYVQTPQVQEGTSSTGEERQVWYFQKLQFLEDHLNTSNIKLEEYGVETDQMEMFEPEITTQIDLENSTLDPLAASIKIEVEEPCLSEPTMKHENTAEMNGEDVKFKDENDIFGDFVAAQLKKITDDEVRQDAVFEIHKILHTALRKK